MVIFSKFLKRRPSSIVPYSVLDNPAPNRYHTTSEPTKKMSSVIGLGARRFQGYELGDVASPGPTDYRPEKPKRSLKIQIKQAPRQLHQDTSKTPGPAHYNNQFSSFFALDQLYAIKGQI